MEYSVRLERHSGTPLAVVRRQARPHELSRVVPETCGVVWNVVKSQRLTGAGRHVAIYWDSVINLEVGVELAGEFAGHGEVVPSSTPSGLVAATTHFGPYQNLHCAHEAIQHWCQAKGRKLAGPQWEVYGHWLPEWNSDPSKIVTDVYYLLVGDVEANSS